MWQARDPVPTRLHGYDHDYTGAFKTAINLVSIPLKFSKQPLRALHFIKSDYPREVFETTFHYLFHCFWSPPHLNITQPAILSKVLAEVPSGFTGAGTGPTSETATPLFGPDEVESIMQATSSQEMKDRLQTSTRVVLDRGAFGTPWFWVTNSAGHGEPFFGSDR